MDGRAPFGRSRTSARGTGYRAPFGQFFPAGLPRSGRHTRRGVRYAHASRRKIGRARRRGRALGDRVVRGPRPGTPGGTGAGDRALRRAGAVHRCREPLRLRAAAPGHPGRADPDLHGSRHGAAAPRRASRHHGARRRSGGLRPARLRDPDRPAGRDGRHAAADPPRLQPASRRPHRGAGRGHGDGHQLPADVQSPLLHRRPLLRAADPARLVRPALPGARGPRLEPVCRPDDATGPEPAAPLPGRGAV